jgi:hypothetical protein
VLVWGLSCLLPCLTLELGSSRRPYLANSTADATVVVPNEDGVMKIYYLYEYKGLIYSSLDGLEMGRLKDS